MLSTNRGRGRYPPWRQDHRQALRGYRSEHSLRLEGPTSADEWYLQTGHSVLLHVTDFQHYLYLAAPPSFRPEDCEDFRAYLELHLAQNQSAISNVKMVMRENLFGFQGNTKSPYLKVTVTDPRFMPKLRGLLESKSSPITFRGMWKGVTGGLMTFDSIQYVLRFMIDTGVSQLFAASRRKLTDFIGHRHVLGGGGNWEIHNDTPKRETFQLSDRGARSLQRPDSSPKRRRMGQDGSPQDSVL